jgi:hypothetical protein
MSSQKEIKSINEGLTKMFELTSKLEAEFIKASKTMREGLAAIDEEAKKGLKTQNELAGNQKKQREEITKEQKQAAALLRAKEDLQAAYKNNAIEILKVKKVKQDMLKTQKLEIAAGDGSVKTYDQLSARYRLAAKRAKDLAAQFGVNSDKAREAIVVAKEYNDNLKEVDASIGEHSRNVGNYSDALGGLPGILGEVGSGVDGLGQKFLQLVKNPIVGMLALAAGALAALGKAFASTRSGSVLIQKSMTNLSTGVDVAKKGLRDYTENVQKNIKEQGFWKTAIEEVLRAANPMTAQTKKQGNAYDELYLKVRAAKKELIDLNDAYIDIENESLIRIANLQAEADRLAIIADDDTKSMADMIRARLQLTDVDLKRTREQAKLSNERLKIAEAELKIGIDLGHLRRTEAGEIISMTKEGIELEKAYSEAKIEAIVTSNEVVTVEAENARKRRLIERDVFEQRLDLLLDIADRQKTINEQQLADDRISLEERIGILVETNKLVEDSFDDQVALFKKDLGINLERNKILNLNNAEIVAYAEGLNMSEIATNRLREVIMERRQAIHDLAIAEKDLTDKVYTAQLKAFDDTQTLNALKAENAKKTEEEITVLTIEAKIARYEKELALNDEFNKQLSETEIAIIKERIKALRNELNKDEEKVTIWDKLGFDDESQTKAISSAKQTFNALKNILKSFADERVAQADRVVESTDREVEAAENELNRQVQLAEAGYANNVQNAQIQLNLNKESQKEALRERERSLKSQRQIDSAEQISSLITASANILKGWSTLPFIGQVLGIAAIASMLGAFALTKTKINSSTQKFGEGGILDLEGGSHASGNDIHFGSRGGKELYAEGGEKAAIFSKKASRKYGPVIDNIVKDANRLQLEDRYSKAFNVEALPIVLENNAGLDSTELKNIRDILKRIEKYGGDGEAMDKNGRRRIKKGNITRIVN